MAVQTSSAPASDLRERLASVRQAEAEAKAAREANKAQRTPKADRPLVDCGDGCGAKVKARFLPGHDAKLKSALLKIAHEGDSEAAEAALARLVELKWDRFFVARKSA